MKILNDNELALIKAGEVITLTAVLAVLAAAVIAVVVYKIFVSNKGASVTLPGGWKFTWN